MDTKQFDQTTERYNFLLKKEVIMGLSEKELQEKNNFQEVYGVKDFTDEERQYLIDKYGPKICFNLLD